MVLAFEMLTIYLGGRNIAKSKQINSMIIYKTEFLVTELLGSHYVSIIHNSLKTEATQMSTRGKQLNKMRCHIKWNNVQPQRGRRA